MVVVVGVIMVVVVGVVMVVVVGVIMVMVVVGVAVLVVVLIATAICVVLTTYTHLDTFLKQNPFFRFQIQLCSGIGWPMTLFLNSTSPTSKYNSTHFST